MDPSAPIQEPLIIQSSAKALLGRFFIPSLLLLGLLAMGIYLNQHHPDFGKFILIASALVGLGILGRALLAFLRIKNTEYAVYPNQVQESSYTFKFMGATNNTVKLDEIKQLRCFSNGLLDVWFFNCGKIQMVTSGDQVDFIMKDLHKPMTLKDELEQRIFGEVAENEEGLRASANSAGA